MREEGGMNCRQSHMGTPADGAHENRNSVGHLKKNDDGLSPSTQKHKVDGNISAERPDRFDLGYFN